jgi:hypothetical protein
VRLHPGPIPATHFALPKRLCQVRVHGVFAHAQ